MTILATLATTTRADDLSPEQPLADPMPVEIVDDEPLPQPKTAAPETSSRLAQQQQGQIETLARRIAALENERSQNDTGADEANDDGWVDVTDRPWTIRPGGAVHIDYINWAKNDEDIPNASDYVEFRRVRISFDGTGYGVFGFRAQYEFEPENDRESGVDSPVVRILDNFLDINDSPWFGRVRIGHFFVPFSLEQNTNSPNITFLERAVPITAGFSPSRALGVTSYNVAPDHRATLSYGVFYADVSEFTKERIDDEQGVLAAVRGTWTPYYDIPSDGRYLVHLGLNFYYKDDADDRVRFRSRPAIHEGPVVIDTGTLIANDYSVADFEFATVWGPFSAQSEVFLTNVYADEGNEFLFGYYVFLSYFLTGENRNYEKRTAYFANFGPVIPFTNFWCVKGSRGSGAWELKARYEYLDFNKVGQGYYQDTTVGVNWYWNLNARWMFDWIHPWTSEDTVFGDTQADILAVRFQLTY